MDWTKTLQTAVLGSGKEKPVPTGTAGKFLYCLRYNYLQLLGLNLLFILCCLPVITIPAACCGLSAVTTALVRDKAVSVRHAFFREFKTDFLKRAVLWGLLCIAPLSIGFYAQWLGIGKDGTVCRLLLFTVVFLIQRYWYVCMALIDATPWQNLKNAALLMAVEWQKTGIVLLTAGVLYGVCFLFPLYAFPAMVLCLFSVSHLFCAAALTPVVLKHLAREASCSVG